MTDNKFCIAIINNENLRGRQIQIDIKLKFIKKKMI